MMLRGLLRYEEGAKAECSFDLQNEDCRGDTKRPLFDFESQRAQAEKRKTRGFHHIRCRCRLSRATRLPEKGTVAP